MCSQTSQPPLSVCILSITFTFVWLRFMQSSSFIYCQHPHDLSTPTPLLQPQLTSTRTRFRFSMPCAACFRALTCNLILLAFSPSGVSLISLLFARLPCSANIFHLIYLPAAAAATEPSCTPPFTNSHKYFLR